MYLSPLHMFQQTGCHLQGGFQQRITRTFYIQVYSMVINLTVYLDVKGSCNSLLKTLEDGNSFFETCRGLKYILYMSIIL